MAKSLILVLTPYEMEILRVVLVLALERSQTLQQKKALIRVQEKVEQMLSEYAKDHP